MIDIEAIINRLINLVVWPIFAGVVILMFIWAGFLYLKARGEPEAISKANKAMIWAIVGVIVGVFAFSATQIIKTLLGI